MRFSCRPAGAADAVRPAVSYRAKDRVPVRLDLLAHAAERPPALRALGLRNHASGIGLQARLDYPAGEPPHVFLERLLDLRDGPVAELA